MLTRRGIIGGLGALLAAPAVVKAASLMPVRGIIMPVEVPPTLGEWAYHIDFEIYRRAFLPESQFRTAFAAHLAEAAELYGAASSIR